MITDSYFEYEKMFFHDQLYFFDTTVLVNGAVRSVPSWTNFAWFKLEFGASNISYNSNIDTL